MLVERLTLEDLAKKEIPLFLFTPVLKGERKIILLLVLPFSKGDGCIL